MRRPKNNELKELSAKIKHNSTKVASHSSLYDFASLVSCFDKIPQNQDRPDGIIPLGDTVFILEHFQISVYVDKKHQDLYRKAISPHKRFFEKHLDTPTFETDLKPFKENLLESFKQSLLDHTNQYQAYQKNTQAMYPDTRYKFMLVIEDNSQDILIDTADISKALSILDIEDFVDLILEHQQIDGVILYSTSPRGDFIIAEDTEYLKQRKRMGKLTSMSNAYLLFSLTRVILTNPSLLPQNLSEEEKRLLAIQLHALVGPREELSVFENISIEKSPNS